MNFAHRCFLALSCCYVLNTATTHFQFWIYDKKINGISEITFHCFSYSKSFYIIHDTRANIRNVVLHVNQRTWSEKERKKWDRDGKGHSKWSDCEIYVKAYNQPLWMDKLFSIQISEICPLASPLKKKREQWLFHTYVVAAAQCKKMFRCWDFEIANAENLDSWTLENWHEKQLIVRFLDVYKQTYCVDANVFDIFKTTNPITLTKLLCEITAHQPKIFWIEPNGLFHSTAWKQWHFYVNPKMNAAIFMRIRAPTPDVSHQLTTYSTIGSLFIWKNSHAHAHTNTSTITLTTSKTCNEQQLTSL